MEGCIECKEIINHFDVLGKTYYKVKVSPDEPDSVVELFCYRHWHQKGRPKYEQKGEYNLIVSKNIYRKHVYKSKT